MPLGRSHVTGDLFCDAFSVAKLLLTRPLAASFVRLLSERQGENMIDWSKLKTYKGNKYLSFEELCYQIAKELYGEKGDFTSIDDSGGGDGVEFYLTLPNGDQWGWQAKFYHPNARLSIGNRKQSIKGSLIKACQEHKRLKKWILCTPTNFTPDQKDKKGKRIQGEQTWFKDKLPNSVPENMEVKLEHWSESDFNNWLSSPHFAGKRLYFFGELELTLDWFRTQFKKQEASVRDRFNPVLHTKTNIDRQIHALLGDRAFVERLTKQIKKCEKLLKEYNGSLEDLEGHSPPETDWEDVKANLLNDAKLLQDNLVCAVNKIREARDLLEERRYGDVQHLDWHSIRVRIEESYNKYRTTGLDLDSSKISYKGSDDKKDDVLFIIKHAVGKITSAAGDLLDDITAEFTTLNSISQTDFYIMGGAGTGKTHLACNTCYERLKAGLPALLILGRHFTSNLPLEQQLRNILDIPPTYSWGDFLAALSTAAEAYHTRVPLIIDGLNDSIYNGIFPKVWQLGLPGLAQEIEEKKNVVLIATCRSTYEEAIWPNTKPKNIKYVDGFGSYYVRTAIQKYFDYYKIRADLTEAPLFQFEHPIYLKIFCETQNPTRQKEKQIYVGEQTLFQVFDRYIEQCDRAVCERLGLYYKALLIRPALRKIAGHMWQNHCRSIGMEELPILIDGKPHDELNWSKSKTKAVLDEGLLIYRDWYGDGEVVSFTYDLLGGYMIAQYLISEAHDNLKGFLNSEETKATLFNGDHKSLHPMYEDIRRCLAVLIRIQAGKYLHDLLDDPDSKAFNLSIELMFEIPPKHLDNNCTDLLTRLFQDPENRELLLGLATSTMGRVNHPLNVLFWSKHLRGLTMPERDISWTEYLRANTRQFKEVLLSFESTCKDDGSISDIAAKRLHLLAEYIMWMLTSTTRPLRDQATRSLYWYGRRFPEKFLRLTLSSLKINDPYISERMLAATYGIAMARQYDFNDLSFTENALPKYGRRLYEAIFDSNASYATTHILARDYARLTINIALIHNPHLLTSEEHKRIMPPFTDGGIREWGESKKKDEAEFRDGSPPVHMDFENYTLGRLVMDRSNYDFEHKDYKRLRANLYWRLYDLGYSLKSFGKIDQEIASENWRYGKSEDGSKTDRYGKKYSWIAFYEIAGLRQDYGLLDEWYGDGHIADVDIDPSFPLDIQEYNLVQTDFLGDRSEPVQRWILNGGCPDLKPYLEVNELSDKRGPWILLDGFINQEDSEAKRGRFIFVRGLIVKSKEADEAVEGLKQQNLGGRWLPEIPADYYTYAGEIPWSDTYAPNGESELSFIVDRSRDMTQKFRVLIPVRENCWESYHSAVIPGRSVRVPAKQIAERLGLCSQPQTFDLFEEDGKYASRTFHYVDENKLNTTQRLTYLRKDLLNRFLTETDRKLVWAIWGERKFSSNDEDERNAFIKKHKSYKVFQDVILYNEIQEY